MLPSFQKSEVGKINKNEGKLKKLIAPYDGFNGKKQFKFEQYNRLIELK